MGKKWLSAYKSSKIFETGQDRTKITGNRLRFEKVIGKRLVASFFWDTVYYIYYKIVRCAKVSDHGLFVERCSSLTWKRHAPVM